MALKNEISKYLRTITGRSDALQVHGAPEAELPRYIGDLYALHSATILDVPVVLAILRLSSAPSVVDMSRHWELLKTRTGTRVVFVGNCIGTRTAERLVRRNIPHIIPGRQLYLPFLFLDIKSTAFFFEDIEAPEHAKLSQWAEALLIRQLLRRDLEGTSGADIVRATGMSPMTVQRAVNQLAAARLCQLETRGKRRIMRFDDTESLWSAAHKILTPPCAMTLMLEAAPSELPVFVAGISALAQSTLLVEDDLPTFAASRRFYSRLQRCQSVPIEDAKIRLELWDRDPALTAEHGVVDPISLHLSLRAGDDRVQIALTELLRQRGLGEPS